MTSTELISSEIQRFLKSPEPEVLSVSGQWGVGKTYIWNQLLRKAVESKSVAISRYSYASLFGINSLDGLKLALFENIETLKADDKTATTNSLFGLVKRNRNVANAIPHGEKVLKALEPLFFSRVRDQIICIDDLERTGAGLRLQDVLGLVSFLREQRNCKIVLLLNSDALGDEAPHFRKHSEKVIDVELTFAPSASEAVQIAIDRSDELGPLIADNCRALGISNIRVLKKIERLIRIIEPYLKEYNSRVLKIAAQSLALFGWSRYQPGPPPFPPPLTYLKKYSGFERREPENIPPDELGWSAMLRDYNYQATDEFDLALMSGVENGIFDFQTVQSLAQEISAKLNLQEQDASFESAWRLYHDSFDDNQDEVLDAIANSLRVNVQSVSKTNLNGAVTLLKDLGRAEQARELIQYFVQTRVAERDFWDLDEDSFAENVTDPDVIAALNGKLATFEPEANNPEAILLNIANTRGWNRRDLLVLSALTVEDFTRIFKEQRGRDLSKMIKAALSLGAHAGDGPQMEQISLRTKDALSQIGAESALNARRIRRFGLRPAE